jgi:hypothetical protein
MKGDFSRRTFDPANHYSGVLQEQGRMLTDADLEEEHRILAHRIETEAVDLIGGCGGPIGNAGFAISQSGAELGIGAGRYYVDGILVQNDPAVTYTTQPYRPGAVWPPGPPDDGTPGRRLVYLDVWRRLVTALDDPSIREVALGGPTTASREQTIWQVRTEQVDADASCMDPLPDMGETTGQLAARADPEVAMTEPCEVPPSAGFKGLENQFFRVEVHNGGDAYDLTAAADTVEITGFPAGTTNQVTVAAIGDLAVGISVEVFAQANPLASTFAQITDINGTTLTLSTSLSGFSVADDPFLRRVAATFVWSRDNGSIVTTITRIDGNEITVRDLGRDDVLGFGLGQWVEITDDRNEYEMTPGQLLRIDAIDTARRIITLATPVQPLIPAAPDGSGVDPELHPKLRRWDGAGAIRANAADPADDWIHLEDGIQVRFTPGRYRTDDYWHFPARTAVIDPTLGNIEWPVDTAGDPALLEPAGVAHHYCPLAMVDLIAVDDETLAVDLIIDCRDEFPPVTQLTKLLYVGGDGQEGVPDPADSGSRSVNLGAPLQVRVANGSFPVVGVPVRFAILDASNGRLQNTLSKAVDVLTDANGIASCVWQLDGSMPIQSCVARLLDTAGDPINHQVVHFHASLSRADRVAYNPAECTNLTGAKTVQEAIDRLCKLTNGGGGRCCCIVIGPDGDFPDIQTAVKTLIEQGERDICLCLIPGRHELVGLDMGDLDPDTAWNLSITGCGPGTRLDLLDDLRVTNLYSFALRDLDITVATNAAIHIRQCREVRIDTCHVSGLPPKVGLVRIHFASHIYVGNSILESFVEPNLTGAIEFFDGIGEVQDLYTIHEWREFDISARKVAFELAQRDFGDREALSDDLRNRLDNVVDNLSSGEAAAYLRLIETLILEEVNPLAIYDHLVAIRRAVLRVNPGIALEIGNLVPGRDTTFSAAGTRDGATVLENNDITGLVSVYGVAAPGQILNVDHSSLLRRHLRARGVQLGGLDLGVHVRDNRITRMLVAAELIVELERLAENGEGLLDELINSLHVTNNIFDGESHYFVGHHVVLTSNDFTLSAFRELESTQVPPTVVVGDTAVYTGNHGHLRLSNNTIAVQVFDVTRASAEAASLEVEYPNI